MTSGKLVSRTAEILSALLLLVAGTAAQTAPPPANAFLTPRPFLHIPGPNPIIVRGAKDAWDGDYIEAGDVTEDFGTYYFFYHGAPLDHKKWGPGGYRIGVATAQHPLGPWTKVGDKPLIDVGAPGSWDDTDVACPVVLKEKPGKYDLWYCGVSRGTNGKNRRWGIGFATGPSPLGPWTKYGDGPVIEGFGYVSSVVKKDGKYFLYSEDPISATAEDYGPMSLATADKPEGPWTQWSGNPVLPAGETGAWDDAGYSEAKVMYREGMFHMFYGGSKEYVPRRLTRESIGYAYSTDGMHFTKYGGNPVAPREADPNAAAFAEVHCFFEPPFIYLYHTLRYVDPAKSFMPGDIDVEDLGVEVLATQPDFSLPVPALTSESLAAKASTQLGDVMPVAVKGAARVNLVVEGTYASGAKAGLRVHVRSSIDGMSFDTTDLMSFDSDVQAGTVGRKTVALANPGPFIKVMVDNLDSAHSVSNVKVTAVLSGN